LSNEPIFAYPYILQPSNCFMIKFYCFVLTLLISTASLAQSNFKSGYIINPKGDTIQGLIDDRGDLRNAQRITFQKSANSEKAVLLPTDIEGYSVASKIYVANSVKFEEQATTVFLELINAGTLKLFRWQDPNDKTRFFVQKNTELYELTNDEVRTQEGGKTYSYRTKAYLGLLTSLTSDCGTMPTANFAFNLKAISGYVTKYNTCKGDAVYESSKTQNKTRLSKSVYGGINQTWVATSGTTRFNETTTETGITAGAGLHYSLSSGKLFLDLLAEYNKKGAVAEKERITFDLHYINISPGISYVYPKGKLKPMLGAGFVAGYLLNKESAYTRMSYDRQIRLFHSSTTGSSDAEAVTEIGYQLRGGVKYALNDKLGLLLLMRYSKSMINFNFSSGIYSNELASVQVGIEF
jgi:opacity protein-like surface antigen